MFLLINYLGLYMIVGMLSTAHERVKLSRTDVNDKGPDVVMAYEFGSRIVGANLISNTGDPVSSLRHKERITITFDLITQVSA